MYPRVETILVPDTIPLELVGAYVTNEATKTINETGKATVNPKSFTLKPIHPRFWVLSFECITPYSADAGLSRKFEVLKRIEVIENDNREDGKKEVVHMVGLLPDSKNAGAKVPVPAKVGSGKAVKNTGDTK